MAMTLTFMVFIILLSIGLSIYGAISDSRETVSPKSTPVLKYLTSYTPPIKKPTRKSTKLEVLEYNLQNTRYREHILVLGGAALGAGVVWALAHRSVNNHELAADIAQQLPDFYNNIAAPYNSSKLEIPDQTPIDNNIDIPIIQPTEIDTSLVGAPPLDDIFSPEIDMDNDYSASDLGDEDDVTDVNGNGYDIDNTIDYDYGQVIDPPDNVDFQPVDIQPDMDFFPFT